jgi:hypothetical protein
MKKMLFVLMFAVVATFAAFSVSAAVTGCVNAYQYNDTGNVTNVTVGNVCVNATSYDVNPTVAVHCGSPLYNCVADAQSATQYYLGYLGTGTCTATDWQATGTTLTLTGNRKITTTEHAVECSAYGYGQTYTKTDFKNIVVDGLGTVGAAVVDWLDLVVLLLVLGFIIGVFVKMRNLFQ